MSYVKWSLTERVIFFFRWWINCHQIAIDDILAYDESRSRVQRCPIISLRLRATLKIIHKQLTDILFTVKRVQRTNVLPSHSWTEVHAITRHFTTTTPTSPFVYIYCLVAVVSKSAVSVEYRAHGRKHSRSTCAFVRSLDSSWLILFLTRLQSSRILGDSGRGLKYWKHRLYVSIW
jgi:hypothetical protein